MATSHRREPAEPAEPAEESDAERQARARREEQAAQAAADRLTEHLPKPGEPLKPPLTPAEWRAAGEPTVKMLLPIPVTLTLPGYIMIKFPAGIVDVPKSLADHDYLLAHGASLVN